MRCTGCFRAGGGLWLSMDDASAVAASAFARHYAALIDMHIRYGHTLSGGLLRLSNAGGGVSGDRWRWALQSVIVLCQPGPTSTRRATVAARRRYALFSSHSKCATGIC